ncbi:MAG: hypothetical protein AAFO15_02150, partial [Pseudomonadota bacterium]
MLEKIENKKKERAFKAINEQPKLVTWKLGNDSKIFEYDRSNGKFTIQEFEFDFDKGNGFKIKIKYDV